MVRHDHKTVAKVQKIVLMVKGVDRMSWSPEKLKLGGFIDAKQGNDDKEQSLQKKGKKSAHHAISDESAPVLAGTEYPGLFGKKVNIPEPVHKGPLRFYNFQQEAYKQLSASAKKDVDNRRKASTSSSLNSTKGSSSSSGSGSAWAFSSLASSGGDSSSAPASALFSASSSSSAVVSSSSTSSLAPSKDCNVGDQRIAKLSQSSSSSSSSSGAAGMSLSSSSRKAPSKDDNDSDEEDNPMSCIVRGYEALDEEDNEDNGFNQDEEEACLIASILVAMQNSMGDQIDISNLAQSKEEGSSAKRPREHHEPYWIPQYHNESKHDDKEGVDQNDYNMSVLQIDESLFGRQKYHKGTHHISHLPS